MGRMKIDYERRHISGNVPLSLFEKVSRLSKETGIPLSTIYWRALEQYIERIINTENHEPEPIP